LIGDEPRDVLNYHSTSPTFPEETIADQWFSESQFESYRALGSHMIQTICAAPRSTGNGKPEMVVTGSARISAGAATGQEVSIEGRIEKPDPGPGPEGAKVEGRIKAAIASLAGPVSPTGTPPDSPRCDTFYDFASQASAHLKRPRESKPKDS
jgi:hypothetical protein